MEKNIVFFMLQNSNIFYKNKLLKIKDKYKNQYKNTQQ